MPEHVSAFAGRWFGGRRGVRAAAWGLGLRVQSSGFSLGALATNARGEDA